MPFTGPFEDRAAIRELYDSYADAAFRDDGQAWLACWAKDGLWSTAFGDSRGAEALTAQWDMIVAAFDAVGFFTQIGSIEVDGDRAQARCYCREILHLKNGQVMKVTGRYDDDLVREGGAWRFAKRNYTVLIPEAAV